jgi:hypothetical protein
VGPTEVLINSKDFKRIQIEFQTELNLIHSKSDLTRLKKIEIKYGFEGFDERNNFHYRNLLRLKIYF